MSQILIFIKMGACAIQPVAFNEHPSTCGHLIGLRNKLQQKQICQFTEVVLW